MKTIGNLTKLLFTRTAATGGPRRTTRTTSYVVVAIALALLGASAFAIAPSPPVTYTPGDLNGQNGWDGGLVGGSPVPFTNNNAGSDVVVNTTAFAGTQSWLLGGSYDSPGAGTPFTPDVATVGALNATDAGSPITPAGNKSVVSFAFLAAAPGDGSRINVYEGSHARDDRTGASLYLRNDTVNGNPVGTVSLYNFVSMNDAPDCNTPRVNLGFVTANAWHTVEMTTVYPNLIVGDTTTYGSTTYVFDKGTPGQQTMTMQSWAHAWRNCNSFAYTPGGSLKWVSSFNDYPAHQGFYIDDVSMRIENTTTNTTVATFATGFESTLPATITVHKIVDAGGASPTAFCFTLDPDPNNTGQVCATAGGDAVFSDLPAGGYTATETTSPANYHQVSSTCSGLIVNAGDNAPCIVHDTINTGTITVHKIVDAGGASPTVFCFTLSPDPGNGQVCANGSGNAIFSNVPAGTYSATETAGPSNYHQVAGSNPCTGLNIVADGTQLSCDVHNTFTAVTHDVEVHLTTPADITLGTTGVDISDIKGDCKNKTGPESLRCTVQLTELPAQCTIQSSGPDKLFGTADDGPVIMGPGSMAGGSPNPTFLVDTTSSYTMNQTKKFDFKLKTTCVPPFVKGMTATVKVKACADGGFLDPFHPCEDTDIAPKHAPNVIDKTIKLKR